VRLRESFTHPSSPIPQLHTDARERQLLGVGRIHFHRDQADNTSLRHRKRLVAEIRDVFGAPDLPSALGRAEATADRWEPLSPQATGALEEEVEKCLAAFAFPAAHRRRIRITNGLE
jgi:putative transposase